MIKDYNTYIKENEQPLALPPHIPEVNDSKFVYSMTSLYNIDNNDVKLMSDRINTLLSNGLYLKLRDKKNDIFHINHNEPLVVFSVKGNSSFSWRTYKDVFVKEDSIVICCKMDESLFIISYKDFYKYEIIFLKPKKIISEADPYGEEDWNN